MGTYTTCLLYTSVKEEEPEILRQSYDMDCSMTLRIRSSMMPKLRARLEKVETDVYKRQVQHPSK